MRKDVDITALIQDYIDDVLTISELMSKYKVSQWFVFNVIKKNNVPRKLKMSGITSKNIGQ